MISFTCLPECVPMVESLRAANGYRVDVPAHREVGGSITTLMTDGSATAVLIRAASEVATIDIWGIAQASAAALQDLPWERIRFYSIRTAQMSSPRFSIESAMSSFWCMAL